jgi:exodeoxyribonuclease V alpha subunit
VTLTAPTGKAAKRIEELSGREAKTIHRLLGYDGRTFAKGPDDPIDADVLILDELSMVDVTLAWRLFRALDLSRTSVILVGDHNQLPPVGPGNVLRDLIRTKALPGTILEVCLRQAGVLKENSTAILRGEVRKTSEKHPDGRCDWYVVDHFTDPSGVTGCLRELFSNILEEKLGFDLLRDVQVLTPTHKGPLGTQALNEEIQRLVQRKRFGVNVPPHQPNHRPPLLKGDKVIQTRNNYTLGVMNGTVGLVRNIWPDGTYVFEFDGEEIAIKKNDAALRDIQLGFALSGHRAQGSEFPCAIVIMHKSSIFYTGVTAAKE